MRVGKSMGQAVLLVTFRADDGGVFVRIATPEWMEAFRCDRKILFCHLSMLSDEMLLASAREVLVHDAILRFIRLYVYLLSAYGTCRHLIEYLAFESAGVILILVMGETKCSLAVLTREGKEIELLATDEITVLAKTGEIHSVIREKWCER